MLATSASQARLHRRVRGALSRGARSSPLGREDAPQRAPHPLDPGALPGGALHPCRARRPGRGVLDAPASRPALGGRRMGQGPSATVPGAVRGALGGGHRGGRGPPGGPALPRGALRGPGPGPGQRCWVACSPTWARRSTRRSWSNPIPSRGPDGRHHAGTAISARSMGRWRTDLTPEEQVVVQAHRGRDAAAGWATHSTETTAGAAGRALSRPMHETSQRRPSARRLGLIRGHPPPATVAR